jgi:hypothetical protein
MGYFRWTAPGSKTLLLAVLLVVSGLFLHAQEYRGTIYGAVADPNGAMVPGAVVTAAGPQQTYHATANSKGEFVIPFVELGVYTVSVYAPGFGTEKQSNIHIDVAAKIELKFTLKVGSTAESITVSDNAVGLNMADASGGTVMDPEKIQNLPMNGRQVYQMLSLTPGTKFTSTIGPNGDSGSRGWDETNAYSINGQSGQYNQITLNGAPISTQGGGGAGAWNIAPNLDAVEEFKVMTNTYDAAYGREAGGTVNTVLKSGGNQFHGTAFDFWRNSILDANSFQFNQTNQKRPFHNEHQFGGTVGGPVLKNKTFFFFSFEGWREVLPVPVQTGTITPDMLPATSGADVDLNNYLSTNGVSGIYDPTTKVDVCMEYDPNDQTTCIEYGHHQIENSKGVLNVIPGDRISKIGLAFLNLYPKPNNGTGYSNNYVHADPGRYQYNQPIGRIDQVFTDKTRMYAMFAWWSGTETRNGSGLPGAIAQGDFNYRSSLTQILDLTHVFTPSITSDVRLSFNRAWNTSADGAAGAGLYPDFTAKSLGLTMPAIPTTSNQWPPEINMYNCCTANIIGNKNNPSLYETYDFGPSVMHVIKKHNLHYGFETMLFHDIPSGVGQPNGQFTFGSQFTRQDPYKQNNNDGDGIAALLLGYPDGSDNQGYVQDWESVYESYNYYAAYIQDDWKIRHNLTLNLGLRWETESSPRDRQNRLNAGFCLTCTNPITSQINYGALAPGVSLPNPLVGGYQFASGSFPAYVNYFGTMLPKIGVSYAITPHLVARGGYGINTALGIELGAQSTWQTNTNYISTTDNYQSPTEYFNQGVPYPNGFNVPPGNSQGLESGIGMGAAFDRRERKIPRVQQYSFGFQGEAPAGIIWDVEYVGTHATRLRSAIHLDSISPADWAKGHDNPQYLNASLPNPFYGVLPSTTDMGAPKTLSTKHLMTPYPQFTYVYDYADPQGFSEYNSLIAKAEKHLSGQGALIKGLSFLASFTWSKSFDGTGRLNNNRDGLVDPEPTKVIDTNDHLWDLAFSGLYGLPIGKGGLIASNAHGVLGELINDWQLDWIFADDSGTPVNYPNTYLFNCGTYNIRPAHRSSESYLNNTQTSCFQNFPSFTTKTHLARTEAVRNPWGQQTAMGMEKHFLITKTTNLQFKAEAFNLTNTPIFGINSDGNAPNPLQGPSRNSQVADPNAPGAWSGYGTLSSSQNNYPRQIQFSLKLLF